MKPAFDLEPLLRRLHLPTVCRIYVELSDRAEKEGMSYRDYLALLMAEEVAHRTETRIQRAVRRAHFPFLRTIEEFDFTFQTSVKLSLLGSYLGPELVSEGRGLILSGPTGTGKTSLSIAIAYRAIQNGFEASFTTAPELIDHLSAASREGRLREAVAAYTHPHVLVIDEVGYLTCGTDAANVLFQVVNERHLKRRPMLFTTNKPIEAWGKVLHDADLAEAILDRVLERGRVLYLSGASYRTRHLGSTRTRASSDPSLLEGRPSSTPSSPPPPGGGGGRNVPRPNDPAARGVTEDGGAPSAPPSDGAPVAARTVAPAGGARISGKRAPEFLELTS